VDVIGAGRDFDAHHLLPCQGGVPPMTQEQRNRYKAQLKHRCLNIRPCARFAQD